MNNVSGDLKPALQSDGVSHLELGFCWLGTSIFMKVFFPMDSFRDITYFHSVSTWHVLRFCFEFTVMSFSDVNFFLFFKKYLISMNQLDQIMLTYKGAAAAASVKLKWACENDSTCQCLFCTYSDVLLSSFYTTQYSFMKCL